MHQTPKYQENQTPAARLKRLEEWLRSEVVKLSQQRHQVGLSLGSQEMRDRLVEINFREKVLFEVIKELQIESDPEDWADQFTNPEEDGSLYADSWS